MKRELIPCLSLLLLLAGCQPSAAQQEESPTTFILVRHAEKATDGSKNPPLTEQGA